MARVLVGAALLSILVAVLVITLGRIGILLAAGVVALSVAWWFRRDSERETAALRRSIDLSATDIAGVLDSWDEFRHSAAPHHVRDRELHRPELGDTDCAISSVTTFHTAADSGERFLRHLPERAGSLTSVTELTELLRETDRRAARLHELWGRARYDAANSRHP